MFNTNSWNRIRYSLYKPFYDVIATYFRPFRSESIRSLSFRKDAKVLIIGAGTGLDLEFLIGHTNITAIDLTPAMLEKLKDRAQTLAIPVDVNVMDASNLEFENDTFDIVILHLILAVMPDPVSGLQEVERVLKPNGKFTVMDKFITPGTSPSFFRKLINPLTSFLATTVTRDIDSLLAQTSLIKEKHEKLGSIFWLVQGSKPSD